MTRASRLAALGLLAAVLVSCSLFDYSGIVTHKYALVYGVTGYISTSDPNYGPYVAAYPKKDPNLAFPDADAKSMASTLRQAGYDVIARWVDASGDEWYSTNATPNGALLANISSDAAGVNGPSKANIQIDINTYFAGKVGPNDVFAFYFSGHGAQDSSTTPPHEFFIPLGAVQWLSNGYYAVESSCVRDDEFGSYLAGLPTPRKIVILDTCNSGGFIGNSLEVDWTPSAYTGGPPLVSPTTLFEAIANYASMQSSPTGLSPYGAQVISAAGRDELSYEAGSPFNHGVMSYFLLQGLEGSVADLNHDRHVTVLEAFAYAKAGVDQVWNADAGVVANGEVFEPHVSGGPVDFVLF